MENLLKRLVVAVIHGIVVGLIVALVLFIISALIPAVEIDAGKWGLVAGILAGLYSFVTGRT